MRRANAGFILAVVWGCGAALTGGEVARRDGPVPTRTIVDSLGRPCCRESGYPTAVQLVVRTRAEWEAAWRTLGGARSPLRLPEVDFGREMVLVVAAGTRPSGGWTLAIEGAERAGEALRVSVLESSPGRHCLVTQMLTHPAAAVVVPRLPGPVSFSQRTVARDCG